MSFPDKAERQRCHGARDEYWRCLTERNVVSDQVPEECKQLRKAFETSCPGSWVKHFDRKFLYEQFKDKMKQGYDPLEQNKQ